MSMHRGFLRIVDANYNRAKEALRVCEDISRFFLGDRSLTARFKRCRHELTQCLLGLPVPYKRWIAARDSMRDVGSASRIQDGKSRPGWKELMIANLQRGQEAARVLEEVSKALWPRRSRRFQELRFDLYELERRSLRRL